MTDEPQAITGYRTLSIAEIDLINEGKALAESVGAFIEKVKTSLEAETQADGRWLSIGVTDIQKGFMAVIRSIAKPTTF